MLKLNHEIIESIVPNRKHNLFLYFHATNHEKEQSDANIFGIFMRIFRSLHKFCKELDAAVVGTTDCRLELETNFRHQHKSHNGQVVCFGVQISYLITVGYRMFSIRS